MARVLAVVPFFGGTSSATHSLEETRLDYLTRTLDSLTELGWQATVYQTRKDKVDVPMSVRLDIPPIHLPFAACVHAQKLGGDSEFVAYTEADQVWHLHDEDVLNQADDEQYVVPWRLDLVGPNGECESPGSAQIEMDGAMYAVANGGHRVPKDGDQWGFIDFHAQQQAFAGAWLARRDLFGRIPFRRMTVLPVEHASGFDIKSIATAIRTTWVQRFWIDHLSPRDRWDTSLESDES
jgi:hypothetical protein